MKPMQVLALGAAVLTTGAISVSEPALADGYRNFHKPSHVSGWGRRRWQLGRDWSLADAGALNTNPYYFPTYSSPYGYVAYAYGPYGYGYGYGYRPGRPWLGYR